MHENLKFTLNLNEKIKEFESFENKQNENPEHKAQMADWQPIYSGTDYRTKYFIYTKFIGKTTTEGFEVNKIQSYIQNYDGLVSIGFNGYSVISEQTIMGNDPDIDPRFPNRKKYELKFGLTGLNIEKNINILTTENLVIKHGDVLKTSTFFTPANPQISRIYDKATHKKSNFVDEKFMTRMGDDIFISDEGIDKLIKLLDLGQVSEQDIANAGIDLTEERVNTVINLYSNIETLGKKFPCKPIYSFCFCQ